MLKEQDKIRYQFIQALGQSPLLRFIGRSAAVNNELREMLQHCEVVTFNRGRIIIGEGDSGDQMFFLASGEVEVRKDGVPVCVLNQPGDVFGELSAITGELRSASVVAKNDVRCLVTDSGLVDRLSREGKHLFLHVLQQALTRVFTERLKVTTQERVVLQDQIEEVKRENTSLRSQNARLRQELEEERKGQRGRTGAGNLNEFPAQRQNPSAPDRTKKPSA